MAVIRGVVFDMDQTLLDTDCLKEIRSRRDWSTAKRLAHTAKIYDGVEELLGELAAAKIPLAVVTNSPTHLATHMLETHGLHAYDFKVVGYGDVPPGQKKPHPAPMLKAASDLGVPATELVTVGDDPKDIQSGKAAGMVTIAAAWGCADVATLEASRADHIVHDSRELRAVLKTLGINF